MRPEPPTGGAHGVLVVGSGTRFISGISHYTRYAALALSRRVPVTVILMRRLIPRALYPGRARVGAQLTAESYPPDMDVFDGVDWYWIPSILRALHRLWRARPEAVLFQWWTGAVLHSYIALAAAARLRGSRVIVEVHEIQDTGEAEIAPARAYVERLGHLFMRMADAFIVHSEFDRAALADGIDLGRRPVSVVRHGPYSHYDVAGAEPLREAPLDACNILFFGTIRPYKGLEDLVRAFDLLAAGEPERGYWLTVVGETWEEWTEPLSLIASSPSRDRITLVNEYVSDGDAARWFAGADLLALPYRRSSASGPLHMTMDAGLPVVICDVGGLREAAGGYPGAVLVRPADPADLAAGIRRAADMRGTSFDDEGSWDDHADAVLSLVASLGPHPSR